MVQGVVVVVTSVLLLLLLLLLVLLVVVVLTNYSFHHVVVSRLQLPLLVLRWVWLPHRPSASYWTAWWMVADVQGRRMYRWRCLGTPVGVPGAHVVGDTAVNPVWLTVSPIAASAGVAPPCGVGTAVRGKQTVSHHWLLCGQLEVRPASAVPSTR